jgi:hypothetical protein
MGATTAMKFESQMRVIGPFASAIENSEIKNEPMFFNCNTDYALAHGGPITAAFFAALPADWHDCPVVFDSRVHMLMPGWFPAIPGFHHDDVPRPSIPVGHHFVTAGQPDYDNPRYRSEHICGLVNADIAPTNFAIGQCTMPAVPDGLIYRAWHGEVTRLIETGEMESVSAPDRQLVYFDCDDFHQGTKAVDAGWRWFGRISRNTDRVNSVTNEIRRQAQVYLEFPMEGW